MKRKIFIALILFSLTTACAPEREVVRPVPPSPPVAVKPPPPPTYRTVLNCEDRTTDVFNRSGMEVMPFIRVVFYDIDGDGAQDLIAGTKDGSLRLYRQHEENGRLIWRSVDDYFDGIQVGAFSAPAVGDVDGDGTADIAVGTGGFSKDSGKVLFYRNAGSFTGPLWKQMPSNVIDVGNDAAPAMVDVDQDGRPDLIVGDSTGLLVLFRNQSKGGQLNFVRDKNYFRNTDIGMYAVPAAAVMNGKIVVIAGSSMGKVILYERGTDPLSMWVRNTLDLGIPTFAAPAFFRNGKDGKVDLVVSDGDGRLHYFRSKDGTYRSWTAESHSFEERILAGAACAPSLCVIDGVSYLVVGNINGDMKLYEYRQMDDDVPWRERPGFFSSIKLSSFAHGFLTSWEGRQLLITGQQDGIIRAFYNEGTIAKPKWMEQKQFFSGVPKMLHASPTVFDLDGDGGWELVVGDVDGYVKAYGFTRGYDGRIFWRERGGYFEHVKVARYATPSLIRDGNTSWLFVGQQDGKVLTYVTKQELYRTDHFYPVGPLDGIKMRNHSSPWVIENNGLFELSVGDYDGNLKHFACRKEQQEVPAY